MRSLVSIAMVCLLWLAGAGLGGESCASAPAAAPAAARTTRLLDEAELNTMLTAALQHDQVRDRGVLELRFTRAWTPVTVPDTALEIRILELPTAGVTANFIVRFQIAARGEPLGNWQMPVRAQIWREVPVARALLRRGQLLTASDFTLERRDQLALRDTVWDGVIGGPALDLAENVMAGGVLYARSVALRPVVRRGQSVQGLLRDGAMSIGMKVEVLEDGVPGQLIRVRNPQTLRELRGKVENEQAIEISL